MSIWPYEHGADLDRRCGDELHSVLTQILARSI